MSQSFNTFSVNPIHFRAVPHHHTSCCPNKSAKESTGIMRGWNNIEYCEILELKGKKWYDNDTNRKGIKYGKHIWRSIPNNSKWLPEADYPHNQWNFRRNIYRRRRNPFFPNEHFLNQQNEADKKRITDTNFTVLGRIPKKYHVSVKAACRMEKSQ